MYSGDVLQSCTGLILSRAWISKHSFEDSPRPHNPISRNLPAPSRYSPTPFDRSIAAAPSSWKLIAPRLCGKRCCELLALSQEFCGGHEGEGPLRAGNESTGGHILAT